MDPNTYFSQQTQFNEKRNLVGREVHIFQVIDGTSISPEIAMAIASGKPITKCPLKNVSDETANFVISHFRKLINFEDKRITIVFDIDEFPYIKTFVDERDPNIMYTEPSNPKDPFPDDVKNTYNSYNQKTHIPIIIVNLDKSFTGLKLIPLPSDS